MPNRNNEVSCSAGLKLCNRILSAAFQGTSVPYFEKIAHFINYSGWLVGHCLAFLIELFLPLEPQPGANHNVSKAHKHLLEPCKNHREQVVHRLDISN